MLKNYSQKTSILRGFGGGFGDPFGTLWGRKNGYFRRFFEDMLDWFPPSAQEAILDAKSIDFEAIWEGWGSLLGRFGRGKSRILADFLTICSGEDFTCKKYGFGKDSERIFRGLGKILRAFWITDNGGLGKILRAFWRTVQHSTVQYSTAQHSKAQYSTVQYNTVQYSTV